MKVLDIAPRDRAINMATDGVVKSRSQQFFFGNDSEPVNDCHKTEALAVATLEEAQLNATPSPRLNNETSKMSPGSHEVTNQTPSEIAALKAGLAIDNTSCRAITLKGRPCKLPTPAKNQALITSLLRTLDSMTQASEELLPTLEKLSRLAHCRWHDCGNPSDSRVDVWLEAIPRGTIHGKSPALITRQIKKALHGVTPVCSGITKSKKQCSRLIGGQKVQNCSNTIAQMVLLDGSLEGIMVELLLSVFEANRYCHHHMSQLSMSNVTRWSAQLADIRKEDTGACKLGKSSKGSSTRVKQKQDIITPATMSPDLREKIKTMLHRRIQPSTTVSSDGLPWTTEDLAAFWSPGRDFTPLDIVSNTGEGVDKESLNPSVCDVATKPLDEIDRTSGHVYLYEVDDNPGIVKIGYTLRAVADRHAEWAFQCNRTVKVLYPATPDQLERVPNACKIEALCHAELDEFRVRVFCHGCLKQHIEWFEMDASQAISSIQKWSAWMKSSPYQKTAGKEYRLSSKWQAMTTDCKKFTKSVSTFAQQLN